MSSSVFVGVVSWDRREVERSVVLSRRCTFLMRSFHFCPATLTRIVFNRSPALTTTPTSWRYFCALATLAIIEAKREVLLSIDQT
jgi:hypothetical protein